jgi:hypothetical protein
VAIKELRERMALAPDLPPPSPMRQERGTALGIVLRLGGLVALAAILACAFVWISMPRPQTASDASPRFQAIAAGDQPGSPPAGEENGSGAESGASPTSEKGFPAVLPQRLQGGAWPLPDRGGDDASSLVSPTTGTAVPSPAAGPQHPAAPSPSAAAPGSDCEEVAALIARGQTYLANGDVVSARLVFRRAAETGDAQATLALGGTYDPLVLRSLGVIGVAVDPAQARGWYQKAADLGSREAPQRIDQLAQWTR